MDNNLDKEVDTSNTTPKEEAKPVSIFQYIADTYNKNHGLPKDFSLANYVAPILKEVYIPGKYEVVVTSIGEVHPDRPFVEYFKEMYMNSLSESTFEELSKKIENLFIIKPIMAIDQLPDCVRFLNENWNMEKSRFLINMALHLIHFSVNIEAVKFGIGILGLINSEDNPNVVQLVMVLSLCEDFTYFCNRIIKGYSDGNDRLIEILTRLQGWGKFDILKMIDIPSVEVAAWIIRHGMEGTIEKELMAPAIATRIALAEFVESYNEMDEEFLMSICEIIEGITSSKLEEGILEKVPDYEILFGALLDKYEKMEDSEKIKKYIICIKDCLETKKTKRELNISEQIILERIQNLI